MVGSPIDRQACTVAGEFESSEDRRPPVQPGLRHFELRRDLEQQILQNLVNAPKRRTIFAITHRLSMADIADRVLVLKDGRLVEEGSAADLVKAGGEFWRLQQAAQAGLTRRRHAPPDSVGTSGTSSS